MLFIATDVVTHASASLIALAVDYDSLPAAHIKLAKNPPTHNNKPRILLFAGVADALIGGRSTGGGVAKTHYLMSKQGFSSEDTSVY